VEAAASEIVLINRGRKLQHAAPEQLLSLLDGKVWQWVIAPDKLSELKREHLVSGVLRRENGMQVRVVSETAPAPQAERVAPSLEDVYLREVSQEGAAR